MLCSLDQLLVSAGDQQRLQSVLSSVGSKCTVLTLIQEAEAQSQVSGTRKRQDGMLWREGPGLCRSEPRALLRVGCCEFGWRSLARL